MRKLLIVVLFFILSSPALAATTYYVKSGGGGAGTYESPFNTLKSDGWATQPTSGDTVYVLGTFYGGASNISHLSLDNMAGVTIRGDYPGEPAVIIGMVYRWTDGWTDEEDGTWSRSFTNYVDSQCDFALEDDATTDLTPAADLAECQSIAGKYWYNSGTNTLYYHPTDGLDANGHVFSIYAANSTINTGCDGATIRNITFRGSSLTCVNAVNNVSVLYNDFKWGTYYGAIYVGGSSGNYVSGWNISYNTIQYYNAGVYFTTGNGGELTPYETHNNMYVSHNTVKNTAHANYTTTDEDDHAFACQGCYNCTWEYNYAEDVCNGFAAYMYPNVDFYSNKIRYNHFKDGHDAGGATQKATAILESVNNDSTEHNNTNNVYSFNIIENFARGARPTSYDTGYYFNNVFHGCTEAAIRVHRSAGSGLNTDFIAKNNIFSGCTYGFYNATSANSGYSYVMQYNLYTAGTSFYDVISDNTWTFSQWITQSAWGTGTLVPDTTGSLVGDPSFLNAGGSYDLDTDFKIDSDSDAIDAGENVGISTDYWGTSLPQGGAYDMGIHEFLNAVSTNINIQKGMNFSGGAEFRP